MGGMEEDKIAFPVLPLLQFCTRVEVCSGKKEPCFYELSKGAGRRKCKDGNFSILFLKRCF